ncbi:Gfo/Idh/MocA family oxidoreductase [Ktedonosporobacter rubrisoli]|uniref:Gfo/Idh/MocA family oxidoreductase n=1 Tax=Ktedonosporobacter rubrisoli TaxID=2509675 RepID=A0A4P6JQZ3_KTERU|nr:Gfo/Idh/MocA family oxidoreductase [Ktedonosporobacter rubrisoli]QBD77693.1 Gfo/Idh/MocA family oxidoreductase [Ktedonosporobacter rubrisoli]
MRESRVRVGVIGVGGISAHVHLPGLKACPQAEIVALCDTDEARLRQRAQEYHVPHTFTDYQGLLQHPEIDAVVIATPTLFHAPIALDALAAKKHVLVEKQLGMTYAETVQMYEAAQQAGVRHMTAFTYRFVPAMRYLKHLVGQGSIGLPRHLRIARLQDFPEMNLGWRQQRKLAGSGEVGDMGAHRIDFCHDVIGPLARVVALTRTFVPARSTHDGASTTADVEDCALFLAEFADGVGVEQGTIASFDLSKVAKGREHGGRGLDEFEVYGTEGTLIYHLHRSHEVLIGRPDGILETREVPRDYLVYPGSLRDPFLGEPTVTFRYDQDFAFIQAIINGQGNIPTFYDGMRCQAVIDAILQSARERRWVDVADVPTVTAPLAATSY